MASPTDDILKFNAFLNKKGEEKRRKMDGVLHLDSQQSGNVRYEFCLIRCDSSEIRVDDYIDLLYSYISDYALSFSELHPKGLTKEQLTQYFIENMAPLMEKAANEYVTKSHVTGEPGELFLFIALESIGFVRLLNKMALKTSGEVPFHGWDAVHIGVGKKGDLLFSYGSSKLKKDFGKAVYETFKDIEQFTAEPSKEKFEINLVSSCIEKERLGKYSGEIAKMLSAYYRDKQNIGKAHPIYIGYESIELDNPKRQGDCSLDDQIHLCFKGNHDQIVETINSKISSLSKASNREFLVWIMPFNKLRDIRSKFLAKIGAPDTQGEEHYK